MSKDFSWKGGNQPITPFNTMPMPPCSQEKLDEFWANPDVLWPFSQKEMKWNMIYHLCYLSFTLNHIQPSPQETVVSLAIRPYKKMFVCPQRPTVEYQKFESRFLFYFCFLQRPEIWKLKNYNLAVESFMFSISPLNNYPQSLIKPCIVWYSQ